MTQPNICELFLFYQSSIFKKIKIKILIQNSLTSLRADNLDIQYHQGI